MADRTEARVRARSLYELVKGQRLAWSCSVLVGLFLVLIGHIPIFPVLTGCLLAVAFSAVRARASLRPKPVVRSGR